MKRMNKTKNQLVRLWEHLDNAQSEINLAEEKIHYMKLDKNEDYDLHSIDKLLERVDMSVVGAIKEKIEKLIEEKDPNHFRATK